MTASAAALCATVHATENGGVSYPLGVNTIGAGVMPGPGQTWLQNYSAFYDADTFTDSRGHSSVPGFKAEVFVNATRIFHNWNTKIGPFDLLSGVVVPLYSSRTGSALGHERNSGIGDIELQPIYLGYTSPDKTLFSFGGLEVYVPSRADVSSNYYTIATTLYTTWLPTPRLELSGVVGVEFHTRNNDTKYRSGTMFIADYGVNYKPFEKQPGFAVGLGGYLVSQISDDKQNGETVAGGFRQKGFAIGPQISFAGSFGAVGLKWQREFKTENRPEGDKIWLQWMIPLNL
ncbi:transporter [Burkholderia cenocepacia]|uniref:SphA family protein n=1 Tax=Burkholderia cenocepacia TaxID=95486 RepID=UPI002230E017|nr:transporter [Burkholderia cenocepacia]MCW3663922.1 transporter [Burkholderia cenocepacia]